MFFFYVFSFESSVSFIFRIDWLATRETIITVLFCLFSGFLLLIFFGKLTYVLKEEDTNIIRGIPQIYNDNRNIKQQMATG